MRNKRAHTSLLFGNEREDARHETSCAKTYNDDGNEKSSKRPLGMCNDGRDRGNDKNNVADEGNDQGDGNGFESSPLLIRNIGTQEGSDVTPVMWRRIFSPLLR